MDRKENPFDQFDQEPANQFDQFEVTQEVNPFDQFDQLEEPRRAPMARGPIKGPAPRTMAAPAEAENKPSVIDTLQTALSSSSVMPLGAMPFLGSTADLATRVLGNRTEINPEVRKRQFEQMLTSQPPAKQQPAAFPLRPEVRKQLERKYNAMSQKERDMIAARTAKDGSQTIESRFFAFLNQDYQKRDLEAQANAERVGKRGAREIRRFADLTDPRLEARARVARRQGAAPQTAENIAAQQAEEGIAPTKPIPEAKPSDFDFDLNQLYNKQLEGFDPVTRSVIRGAGKGYYGYKQGVLGLEQSFADLLGADDFSSRMGKGAAAAEAKQNAIGQFAGASWLANQFESAVSSTAENLPGILAGVVTGGETLPLTLLGVQAFGREYNNGRSKGLDGFNAAQRGGVMAISEVIGEKIGLPKFMEKISGSLKNKNFNEAADAISEYILKQIPGEQVTTALQFLADKYPNYALNPKATLSDYIQQAGDTFVQTVLQGGGMLGVAKTAEFAFTGGPELATPIAQPPAYGATFPQGMAAPAGQGGWGIGPDGNVRWSSTGGMRPPEAPAAPVGEPPIAPSGAPGGGRIEPTLGQEPVVLSETRQEPVMGEKLTPEQQALVAGYVAQGFTEQEAVERILKKGKRAAIPGLVKPEETISAQEVQARQQAGEAAALGLTAEAASLLAAVDAGGVPAIMTNNLKRIAQENGIQVTKSMTPNDVIDELRAKTTVQRPEGVVAPAEPPIPSPTKPAAETPSAPSLETAVGYIEPVPVPINELSLSKDVPQFKMGADAKGVVEPLVGKFTNIDVAPIQVWRRLDGSLEVISGRHRFDLAKRSGVKEIPAQIHNESDGFTKAHAAILDAELNIRDEQGKVKDYVNYFRESGVSKETAESKGFLARPKGKRAYTIATGGSDELVTALRNDQVGDEAAYYIALNAPNDPRLQAVGIQGVMDGKSANLAVNMMQAIKALGVENNTTTDMFGFDDSAIKEAAAMAQVANRKQREIQTRLSAISGAAKNPAVAKAEGIDIRDPEAVNRRINELRQMKAAWDNWATNPQLIAEIRQDRGVEAPSLTLRGETEEEIRAREEAAAAEERRLRAEEEAAKRAEQEAFDRKRAAETADLFQLGQTAAQQMSGMGDLFAPPVEEKPAEKPAFQVGERVVYNRPESKIFPDEFPAAQIGATVDFVYNNNRVAIVRDDNGQTEVVPANDLAKPSAEKPAALDLMKDGIEGREIPFTEVPNGSEAFQYALGRTEEGGKEAIYRRRANERGTYGGWRWEADKPVAKEPPEVRQARRELAQRVKVTPAVLRRRNALSEWEKSQEPAVAIEPEFTSINIVNGEKPDPSLPASKRLILMPCSAKKGGKGGPAGDLYQGVFFQTYRANTKDRDQPQMVILSAEHGFISPEKRIEPYDRLLDKERADEMLGDMRKLVSEIEQALADIPRAKPKEGYLYDIQDILIVGGKEYQAVMRTALAQMKEEGLINPEASVNATKGGIGEQRQQLGQWLNTLPKAKVEPKVEAAPKKPAAKKETKANEYFVENLGETLPFPDIIEWYRRAYQNMEKARDAYRKGEINNEQFLDQKNEFDEIKAEVEKIEAKEYRKPARVISMTERRQEQIEREEEAEDEAIAEESRVEAIKRLKKEYKPLAEKIWQATAKAKRVLKQSQFPNSLEHQNLQRQIEELEDVIARYNELTMRTPLGASVFNVLPRAMELVKSEGKLERLEEVTKLVAEEPPKGIDKFKAKKKEEPGLFNIEVPGKRDQATWSPDRVDMLVREYEYFQGGRENDTKAYAAFIDPTEFVRATTGPGELRKELLRAEEGLDMKRLREERQTPFLLVEFVPGEKTMWRIEGHEGRHRMAALAASGVKRVPVLIRMVGEAKAWPPVKEQWLSGQKFGPTSREKGDAVQITDLTPISFARRDELQKKFAGEGPFAFNVEEPKKPTGWGSVPTEREPRVNKNQEEQIREEQIRSYQAIRQRLAAIPRKVAEQRLAVGEHFTVHALRTEAQNLKAAIDASRPKRDTAVDFLAWAAKQYADGEISKEVFDVIRAAFDKYPQLLEGLRFSVTQQPEGSSATGQFFSIPRIVRLYKGSSGVDAPRTIRHELTHSLEQMMTPEQRKVVVDAWRKDLEKAMQKHTDKAHKDYFDAVLEFMANPSRAAQDKVVKLQPSYDMYQFSNPSEYWAVNAEDLLGMQLGGAWQRFKRVVQRLFEGIKQVLGFDNKSDVHRVFAEIMGGEMKRLDTKMVYHEAGARALNIEEDKKILNKYGKENTPQTEAERTIADFIMSQYRNGGEFFKDAIENPLQAASEMGNMTIDGLLKARMSTFWYGAGLESRDFAAYKGQLRTTDGLVVASVALDNAIHSANIGVEVLFKGGLAWNNKLGRFVAVDRKKGMHGVYKAERALKKKIGKQLGTDIINSYLEAKRSISIMDELRSREEEFALAKDSYEYMVEQGASEEDLKESRRYMLNAQESLKSVKRAVSSVTMSEDEMYEFAALDKRHPELREILDNFKAVNQNLLKVWYDVGLLSEARYNTLSSIKDYVPWYRIMNDGEDPHTSTQTTTRNLLNIGREKRFKRGAPIKVVDFIVKEGQDTFKVPPSTIVRVEVNGIKVRGEFLSVTPEGELKISMPEGQELETGDLVVVNTTRPIANIIDNMTQNVMRMTINGIRQYAAGRIVNEYATKDPDGNLMIFPSEDEAKGRIPYVLDGKRVIVEISDPLVASSIFGLSQTPLDMFAPMAAISNFTRRTVTLSGAFQLKQVLIDAPNAAVVTGVKHPYLLIGGVIKGLVTALINPVTKKFGIEVEPAINVLKAAGIGGFHDPSRSSEAEVKQRLGVMNRNVYQAVMRLLDHIGDSADMAQRVATYKRVLAETGDEAQAAFQAANVMPFLHRGSSSYAQFFVRNTPFMGASANAIDVFSNALIGGNLKGMRRRKAFARLLQSITMLSALTLLYTMAVSGDPEYEEKDDQTKLRNIIVPGTGVMIPMYSSSAFLWKAIPEMLYNKIINEGTKNEVDRRRLKEALSKAAIDMLGGPTPVPAAIKAPMEILLDHNFLTGRELIPRNLKNVEAFEQFDGRTSEFSKWLSQYTEYSEGKRLLNPIETEHLLRGVFGSIGFSIGWISNNLASQYGERPESTGRETPIIGSFMQPEIGRLNEELFYDLKEEVDKKYKTWSLMMDRGDDKRALEYESKHENLLDLYQDLNKINDALGEINSEIREMETAKGLKLTGKQRRDFINGLRREKMEILDDVIEMRKEAGFDE